MARDVLICDFDLSCSVLARSYSVSLFKNHDLLQFLVCRAILDLLLKLQYIHTAIDSIGTCPDIVESYVMNNGR